MDIDKNSETSHVAMPSAALVTGASRGIGRACAIELSKRGYFILATYSTSADLAQDAVSAIKSIGGDAMAYRLNVADESSVKDFFSTISKQFNLEILVNNAGITKDGLLIRMTDEAFDQVIDVDLRGVFICMREAAKIMIKKRYGRIINIASVVGQSGNAGQANYSAAKAGVIGLTKSVAKELASRNITVNAIAPGYIETDMTNSLPDSVKSAILTHIPMGRVGSPEDVANAVAFLSSDKAGYITGQVLAVNGGLYC